MCLALASDCWYKEHVCGLPKYMFTWSVVTQTITFWHIQNQTDICSSNLSTNNYSLNFNNCFITSKSFNQYFCMSRKFSWVPNWICKIEVLINYYRCKVPADNNSIIKKMSGIFLSTICIWYRVHQWLGTKVTIYSH